MASPPQGSGARQKPPLEQILANTNNQVVNSNTDIFANDIDNAPLPAQTQVKGHVYIAATANNYTVKFTIDGTNYSDLGSLGSNDAGVFEIDIPDGATMNVQISKSGTVLYCRIGQQIA